MAKFVALTRVKVDAKTRHMPGDVLDLSDEAAAPLLAAGAIEAQRKAAAKKAQAPGADAPPGPDAVPPAPGSDAPPSPDVA